MNTIFVHDPYDVFLAVGFGFCYASALLPCIRTLERYKARNKAAGEIRLSERFKQIVRDRKIWLNRITVLLRGALTIVGLACLYGWYSYYLKSFYPADLPGYRVILDWLSLGLFAIGANCWDNDDHHESLYCVTQCLATVTFGFTCALAIPSRLDTQLINHLLPLFKAVFWCVVLFSAYLFNLLFGSAVENILRFKCQMRLKFTIIGLIILGMIGGLGFFDYRLFKAAGIADYLPTLLGLRVIAAAVIIFGVIVVLTLLIEKKQFLSRVRSVLMTYLPMAVLIWVTYKNYKILFPQG